MLILHEIGHALGLTHNMRASQLQPDVFDAQAVEAGLSGSVMDYEAVNVAPEGKLRLGFIKSGQAPTTHGLCSTATENILMLSASLAGALDGSWVVYGNDADDMQRSGNGIDPHVSTTSAAMRLAMLKCDLPICERFKELPGQYVAKAIRAG